MGHRGATATAGAVVMALGVALSGCATAGGLLSGDDDSWDPGSAGGAGGAGGFEPGEGGGSSSSSGGIDSITVLECAGGDQEILVLDFRSGWWTGGGGGEFALTALGAMVEPCSNIHVEYHHFEVGFRNKCVAQSGGAPSCVTIDEYSDLASVEQILSWFDQPTWDDYTQVWILSGSLLDAADVSLTGSLFSHFLGETHGSCIPALFGAGDGFIDHGNSVSTALGLSSVFSTELYEPGFFVFMGFSSESINVDSHMLAGAELSDHLLFSGVSSLADTVNNGYQSAHGDSINPSPGGYQIIAHDTAGRPAIALGEIELPDDGTRPFIIDAGFQRYYAAGTEPGTRQLLQNMVLYLGLVGCKADILK